MLPNRKYRLMPQAIVPRAGSGPTAGVTEARDHRHRGGEHQPGERGVSHGEPPMKASQPGRSWAVVSHAVV